MIYQINTKRLFLASCVALVATAMTFAIRANQIGPLGKLFHISPLEMGWVIGTAFWGFTLSILLGGFLCDWLGMKRLIWIAFTAHIAGIGLTILATDFWTLFFSTLLVGIANGMVEAACNPLVATLYPQQKTAKLNQFHVWFPAGIVIGGLTAFGLDLLQANWQWQMASILVPVLGYGILFLGQSIPVTERVSSGVSTSEMIKACVLPFFLFMVACSMLSSATELGTNQWITELLGNVGVPSILLLVFINGLMALGRSFAGHIEHRFSAIGMLLFSAVFSTTGLLLLGNVQGYWSFAAAAVFAIGICFFWPTMLGFISETMPRTGALGMSTISGAGMLSVSCILPFIGDVYDAQTKAHLPPETSLAHLQNAAPGSAEALVLKAAQLAGGATTLLYVAILPGVLCVVYSVLFVKYKWKNK
jgi:MFS family permease